MNNLPSSLDIFMAQMGILEPVKKSQHAPVYISEPKKEEFKAWSPSFKGEEPPF